MLRMPLVEVYGFVNAGQVSPKYIANKAHKTPSKRNAISYVHPLLVNWALAKDKKIVVLVYFMNFLMIYPLKTFWWILLAFLYDL